MAEVVPLPLDALGLGAVDLLGWSLGGYVGQTVALTWPQRVRHLVIAGSGLGGPDGPRRQLWKDPCVVLSQLLLRVCRRSTGVPSASWVCGHFNDSSRGDL
jgi:pimeloyl-ACP methyl ester carboxylesterase